MPRRLIVMRHAKSSWDADVATDHARPLNPRGQRDAPAIARRLVELTWQPDLVLSSDAARTRETFALMSTTLSSVQRVEYLAAFYNDGFAALRATLGEVPDVFNTVLALGHNPCWEEAVYWLTGESIVLTTANCALLECDEDAWDTTVKHRDTWRLVDVVRPKEL
jgi:phosphohistidine phosphatase SixA